MSPIAQQAIRPAELKQALQTARSELVAEKRHVAEMARAGTRGVVQYKYEVVQYNNARQAQETRAEIAQWRKMGRREEQRRLARDAAKHEQVLAGRANAALAKEEKLREKQAEAREELRTLRGQIAVAISEREALHQSAKERASHQFDRRYMSEEECLASLEKLNLDQTSQTPTSYYSMEADTAGPYRRKTRDAHVAMANAALYRRIQQVKAIVDVDISDESAGAARATMAAESKERKEGEARQLADENKAYEKMIASAVSKTDDGDGLSTAQNHENGPLQRDEAALESFIQSL